MSGGEIDEDPPFPPWAAVLGLLFAIAGIAGPIYGLITFPKDPAEADQPRATATWEMPAVPIPSPLTRRGLLLAMDRLPEGRVYRITLRSDRLVARVAAAEGPLLVTVRTEGDVATFRFDESFAGEAVRLDSAAPRRIRAAVDGEPESLELSSAGWQILMYDGSEYTADVHGRHVRPAR